MAFIDELVQSLIQPQGAPNQPPISTPPFVPSGGQSPAPQQTLQPILPNQIGVPSRSQRLPFGEIQTPDREMKDVTPPSVPFFKDKNKMAMMLSMLSNGFGNMSMKGNGGMRQMNNAVFANAVQQDKNNKTMSYLAGHNPDMYKILKQIPEDQRGDYMKLAMQSKFKGLTGENSTADIRNFEYFNSLDEQGQRQFLGLKRGDQMIKGTDGSIQVRRADGTVETLISPQEALAGTSASADATLEGQGNNADFKQAYRAARYADDNIAGMVRQIERLEQFPDRGGIFQPLTQMTNAILAEFGGQEALDKATAEQLNESDNIRRTMQWFQDSGLGARGLDTPAEFMNWLKMNGGNLSMTNEASIQFLKRAIQDQVRNVGRYNEMLDDPVYGTVSNRDSYRRFDVSDPYALPVDDDGWSIK